MSTYETAEAARASVETKCPNCGALPKFDVIEHTFSWGADPIFSVGLIDCSARCYDHDPDAYFKAIAEMAAARIPSDRTAAHRTVRT